MDENLKECLNSVAGQLIELRARHYALVAVVKQLHLDNGGDGKKFDKDLKKYSDTFHQKFLEKLEGYSPAVAAEFDSRKKAGDIDQALLDKLKLTGEDDPHQ